MPLFRAYGKPGAGLAARQPRMRRRNWGTLDDDALVPSLSRLCLLSLADNMKGLWVKDYEDKYLDRYSFRHIMGPFNILPGELVEELTYLLCSRKQISRASLHLLLVPQLRGLSLRGFPGLATPNVCSLVAARCQSLSRLDLSGAQHLPSQVQCDLLGGLPNLRSLSLASTLCDRRVIQALPLCCPALRHVDVSRCHLLSPPALLPLAGRASSPRSPLPLSTLLATDIGFGEAEGDAVAAAAYLLLALPSLEKVAMEGLAQAFALIRRREFGETDEFTRREGAPCLEEVWRETWQEKEDRGRNEENDDDTAAEDEEDADGDFSGVQEQTLPRRGLLGRGVTEAGEDQLTLRLKDVQGLSPASLEAVGPLCPHVRSISLDVDTDDVGLVATGLGAWRGQLCGLAICYPGPAVDLLPSLRVTGSTLVSLTLEGVKTSPRTPLLEVIRACPALRELVFSGEPPTPAFLRALPVMEDDGNLPTLPHLTSLTLAFDYDHSQMKSTASWPSLETVLRSLLSGSPLLDSLSLVAVPCHLDSVLGGVFRGIFHRGPGSAHLPPPPLGQVKHLVLARSDVTMRTVKGVLARCRRIQFLDLSCCWYISRQECTELQVSSRVTLVWT